jgi:hypothetical protein
MAMRKYTDAGKLEVVRGREATVLSKFMQRTGKYQVSEFSDEELEILEKELLRAREEDEQEAKLLQAEAQREKESEEPKEELKESEEESKEESKEEPKDERPRRVRSKKSDESSS